MCSERGSQLKKTLHVLSGMCPVQAQVADIYPPSKKRTPWNLPVITGQTDGIAWSSHYIPQLLCDKHLQGPRMQKTSLQKKYVAVKMLPTISTERGWPHYDYELAYQ